MQERKLRVGVNRLRNAYSVLTGTSFCYPKTIYTEHRLSFSQEGEDGILQDCLIESRLAIISTLDLIILKDSLIPIFFIFVAGVVSISIHFQVARQDLMLRASGT